MAKFIKQLLHYSIYLISSAGGFVVTADTLNTNIVTYGATIYNQNCMRCHNPRPATENSEQEWSVIIPHMRAKAHLTLDEAMAVEAFFEFTLINDKETEKPIEIIATGPELVGQLGCRACHKLEQQGGIIGPQLDGVMSRRGAEFIEHKLKDPKFNNKASAMPKFPLSDDNIKSIIDYLSTLE